MADSILSVPHYCLKSEFPGFCKQLGFEGYNEMKIALAQANASPASLSSYSLDPSSSTSSICEHVYASFQAAITNTMNLLDNKELATIARDKMSTAMAVKLL